MKRTPIWRAYLEVGRDYLGKLPSEFDPSDWSRARWWLALKIVEADEQASALSKVNRR